VRKARWKSTGDVKRFHGTASVLSAERIVFNIKGNDYRLVVSVDFEKGIVWIKWLGTHREYDDIDANKVEHE
jgi:mRNA interferase HigB